MTFYIRESKSFWTIHVLVKIGQKITDTLRLLCMETYEHLCSHRAYIFLNSKFKINQLFSCVLHIEYTGRSRKRVSVFLARDKRLFSTPDLSDWPWGLTSLLISRSQGFFPQVVTLTTYLSSVKNE